MFNLFQLEKKQKIIQKQERSKSLQTYLDQYKQKNWQNQLQNYESKVKCFINKMKTNPIQQKNLGETKFHAFRNEDHSKFLGNKIFTTNMKNLEKNYESPRIKNIKITTINENNIKGTKYKHIRLNSEFNQRISTEPIQKNAIYHKFREENHDKQIHIHNMKFTLPNLQERIITALKEQKGGIDAADQNQFTQQYKKILKIEKNKNIYKKKRAFSNYTKEINQVDTSQVYPYGFNTEQNENDENQKLKTEQCEPKSIMKKKRKTSLSNDSKKSSYTKTFFEINQNHKQLIQKLEEKQKQPMKQLIKKIRLEDYQNISPRKLGQQPVIKTHFQGAKTVELKYNEIYKKRFTIKNQTQYDKKILEKVNNTQNDFFKTEDQNKIVKDTQYYQQQKWKQNQEEQISKNNNELAQTASQILTKCNVKRQKYKDIPFQNSSISGIYYQQL